MRVHGSLSSLVAALHEEFRPQTPFEDSLIENMAVARWRQMRIWGMEKAGMDHEMRRQSGMSNSVSTEDNATRASLAFRTLSDDGRSIELINRYDTRCERQYYRAHRRFLEVRDRRTPPSDEGTFPTSGRTPIHEMPDTHKPCASTRRKSCNFQRNPRSSCKQTVPGHASAGAFFATT